MQALSINTNASTVILPYYINQHTTGSVTRSHTTKCQNENNIGAAENGGEKVVWVLVDACRLWHFRWPRAQENYVPLPQTFVCTS